jgi:hypothetical protein
MQMPCSRCPNPRISAKTLDPALHHAPMQAAHLSIHRLSASFYRSYFLSTPIVEKSGCALA